MPKETMAVTYFLAATAVLLGSCNGDNPTQTLVPQVPGLTPVTQMPQGPQGPLAGTWTGIVTYTKGELSPINGRCPSSETITVDVQETADGQVTATFSSKCYTSAEFKGQATTSHLTGQFSISQHTCNEEGGFIQANGQSAGSFDTSHIQFETGKVETVDCNFGGNQVEVHR